MAVYKYKLTFGNNVHKPSENLTSFEVGQDKETKGMGIRLKGIKFNKRIYQPNEIEAEVDYSNPDFQSSDTINKAVELFKGRIVTVTQMVYADSTAKEPDDTTDIELNYYVNEVTPLVMRDSNDSLMMVVKLSIFSMDKLMTLNKYSKAYVARKLGSGILQLEARKFHKPDEVSQIAIDVKELQNLKYDERITFNIQGKGPVETKISAEYIHPYLVQYNESFYDFMVRSANRYGEFLYFEDGKLTLGLKNTGKDPFVIKDYVTVTSQQSTESVLESSSYRRDSVKGVENINYKKQDVESLNQTFIQKGGEGLPLDTIPTDNEFVYNEEALNDEYLFPLYKDKFTNEDREMNFDGSQGNQAAAALIPLVKTMLKNEESQCKIGAVASFFDFAINDFARNMAKAAIDANFTNKSMDEAHIAPYENFTEQSDETKVVQFGALDSKGWFTLDQYNDIHKKQIQLQRQIVCIDMGTNVIDVKLGQKIKLDKLGDQTYIVIQILQDSEVAWTHTFETYDTNTKGQTEGQRSLKIFAIPAYVKDTKKPNDLKYYPPVQPVSIIRRSGPQTAFITDNNDPKRQGRVRVMYPWQTSLEISNLKKHVSEVDAKTDEIESQETKDRNIVTELEKQWTDTYQRMEKILEFMNLTPQERKKKLDILDGDENVNGSVAEAKKKYDKLEAKCNEPGNKNDKKLKEQRDNAKSEYEKLKQENEDFIDVHRNKLKNPDESDPKKLVDKDPFEGPDAELFKVLSESLKKNQEDLAEAREAYKQSSIKLILQKKEEENINKKLSAMYMTVSSPWIRVATPMATTGGGTYFKPQKGDEVLVDYDYGNIERPYVVGSLFSKNVLEPQEYLARRMTPGGGDPTMAMVSPNGHHITFSDPSGSVEFFENAIMPALGSWSGLTGLKFANLSSDAPKVLGELSDLGGGIHIGDRYGIYEIDMKTQSRSIDIKSPFGTINLDAFTGITINAPNGDVKIKGKNISLEAGNKISITSGTNIPDKDYTEGALLYKAFAKSTVEDITKTYVAGFCDLSLVRNVIETFARPVEGTLLMKSKKYLMLEAGRGKAQVSRDRLIDPEVLKDEEKSYKKLLAFLKKMAGIVDEFIENYDSLWDAAYKSKLAYEKAFDLVKEPGTTSPDILKKAFDERGTDVKELDIDKFKNCLQQDVYNRLINPDYIWEKKLHVGSSSAKITSSNFPSYFILLQACDDFWKSANQYKKNVHELFQYMMPKTFAAKLKENSDPAKNNVIDMILRGSDSWITNQFISWGSNFANNKYDNIFDMNKRKQSDPFYPSTKKTQFKRMSILLFLCCYHVRGGGTANFFRMPYGLHDIKVNKVNNESDWTRLVNKFVLSEPISLSQEAKDSIIGTFVNNNAKQMIDMTKEWNTWKADKEGQILFSDDEWSTQNIDHNGVHSENTTGNSHYLRDFLLDLK